jgi:kynureninase
LIEEDDIIAAMSDDVALVVVPGVYYRSGQCLDLAKLTKAAHQRGIIIGVDACHSVGSVPHAFDKWGVDFAVWCDYKYLNGGPGAVAGLYVNRRHFAEMPTLSGWWGSNKQTQFDMEHEFKSAGHAGAWQIGSPALLSAAPLHGSLNMFNEVGIEKIRAVSLAKTTYLIELMEALGLTRAPYHYSIITPREDHRRGGHVGVSHKEASRICKALRVKGVIPDFRKPDVIRLAPIALYNSYEDIWQVVHQLKQIIDEKAFEAFSTERELVA